MTAYVAYVRFFVMFKHKRYMRFAIEWISVDSQSILHRLCQAKRGRGLVQCNIPECTKHVPNQRDNLQSGMQYVHDTTQYNGLRSESTGFPLFLHLSREAITGISRVTRPCEPSSCTTFWHQLFVPRRLTTSLFHVLYICIGWEQCWRRTHHSSKCRFEKVMADGGSSAQKVVLIWEPGTCFAVMNAQSYTCGKELTRTWGLI